MINHIFEIYIRFDETVNEDLFYSDIFSFFNNIESFEDSFNIEFSCGDGKYLSEIDDDSPDLEKYDGLIDLKYPPKDKETGKVLSSTKTYSFRVKRKPGIDEEYPELRECNFYLNGKKRNETNSDD